MASERMTLPIPSPAKLVRGDDLIRGVVTGDT